MVTGRAGTPSPAAAATTPAALRPVWVGVWAGVQVTLGL
jgi:hypothetical protein